MSHDHNRDGAQVPRPAIPVGNEMVVYTEIRCTCGAVMENNVTSRTKIEEN